MSTKIEKVAPYALDLVIVLSLTVLAGLGKLDAMVVVGVVGPMLGARVANLAKKPDGSGPTIPPSAALLLVAGLSRLVQRSPAS